MGYNTVAVIYNDHLGEMEKGGAVSSRIARAIQEWGLRDRDPLAPHFGCGRIISMAHANYSQVVVCGHNEGRPIVECGNLDHYALGQIADALRRHGWDVKPPKKAVRAQPMKG